MDLKPTMWENEFSGLLLEIDAAVKAAMEIKSWRFADMIDEHHQSWFAVNVQVYWDSRSQNYLKGISQLANILYLWMFDNCEIYINLCIENAKCSNNYKFLRIQIGDFYHFQIFLYSNREF